MTCSSMEENKKLIEKYPFLTPRNCWSGKIVDNYDYSYVEGFEFGWKYIWLEYCENISSWYNNLSHEDKENFCFTELKEKYGQMRIYTSFTSDCERKSNDIASVKSEWTCCQCGKQPRDSKGNHIIWRSRGWIGYFCKECAMKDINYDKKQFKENFTKEKHNRKFFTRHFDENQYIMDLLMEW